MSLAEYYTDKPTYTKVSRGRMNGILALLGDLQDKTILDVGCGAGEVGREIKNKSNAKVYGIDVSSNAVIEAKKVLDAAEVCDIESGSGLPESMRGTKVDGIVISEVLEHLFKPEDLLKQLGKISDASVVVTVPNLLFWRNRLKIFFGSFEYTETGLMDRGHIHFFTWNSIQKTVSDGGYKIEETAHHIPTRGTKTLAKYFPGLFCYQFIVKLVPKHNS